MESKNKPASMRANFVYNIIYQVLLLITPLITSPYVSRVVGVEGIGDYSYTSSMVMIFSIIACIGSGTHGQRGVAMRRDDEHSLTVFTQEIIILRWLTTGVSLLLYIAFIFTQADKYTELYLVQIITIISIGLDITWYFQGLENFRVTVSTQIGVKLFSVASILIFVKSSDDLLFYVAACILPTLMGYIFLWARLGKSVRHVKFKELHLLQHLKPELQLFMPYIGTLLFSHTDKIMLGYMMPDGTENGYYEQALKFITMSNAVVSSISTVIIPRMAYYFKKSDKEHIKFYSIEGTRTIMCISCLLAGGMFAVSPNIIPWFYGDGYEKSIVLLQILSIMMIVKGINNYYGYAILIPAFKQGLYTISIWVSAIVNIILNSVFIIIFDSVGACIASVISEFVLYAFLVFFIRDIMHFGEIIKDSIKYIVAGAIMSVITCFVTNQLTSSIIHTLVLIVMATVIYGVTLIFLRDSFVLSLIKEGLNRVKVLKKK